MDQENQNYQPEPLEPYEQPALPRKTGRRALPLVLLSAIILVSAAVSIVSLVGGAIGEKKLAGETVHPTVVGVVEKEPVEGAFPGGEPVNLTVAEPPDDPVLSSGVKSLNQIYRETINSVVCVQASAGGATSVGTGVVLTETGYIITNYHVVEGMSACSVLLSDDREFAAVLIGGDEQTDLAVLKIEASGLSAATFGDSEALAVGDTVVAIGNPLGVELRGTMTDGIVSAINRNIVIDGREMTVIQTNAALNSGNSGGPLINSAGQVVGINTAKFKSYYSSAVEGIGFAIPIASAKPVIEELIAQGYVSGRPSLGITGDSVPEYAQIYYRLPDGVYVASVDETSDAWTQGIREGDIIVAIGDERVTSADELNTAKNRYQVGESVTLTVYHGGYYYYIEVILGEMGAAG